MGSSKWLILFVTKKSPEVWGSFIFPDGLRQG